MNNPYTREELEKLICAILFYKSCYIEIFDFQANDFSKWKKVFDAIVALPRETRLDKKDRFIALMAKNIPADMIFSLVTDEIAAASVEGSNPKDFVILCEKLRGIVIETEIASRRQELKTAEDVANFNADIEKYKQEQKAQSIKQLLAEDYAKEVKIRQDHLAKHGSSSLVSLMDKFDRKTEISHTELVVLGARTSVGKSSFALNLAYQYAMGGQKVLYINREMGMMQVVDRLMALVSKQPIQHFKQDLLENKSYMTEAQALAENLYLFNGEISSYEILPKFYSLTNLDLIVIDYINILCDKPIGGEGEVGRMTRIMNNLHNLATTKKCAVLALAQLNRESAKTKREPEIYDLKDCGSIEQVAATILLLSQDADKDETKLMVAKRRNGENGGHVDFDFNKRMGTWTEKNCHCSF